MTISTLNPRVQTHLGSQPGPPAPPGSLSLLKSAAHALSDVVIDRFLGKPVQVPLATAKTKLLDFSRTLASDEPLPLGLLPLVHQVEEQLPAVGQPEVTKFFARVKERLSTKVQQTLELAKRDPATFELQLLEIQRFAPRPEQRLSAVNLLVADMSRAEAFSPAAVKTPTAASANTATTPRVAQALQAPARPAATAARRTPPPILNATKSTRLPLRLFAGARVLKDFRQTAEKAAGSTRFLNHIGVSHLKGDHGEHLVMSNTLAAGAYGKLRVGYDYRTGHLVGVKELRMTPAREDTTFQSTEVDVVSEFSAMRQAHGDSMGLQMLRARHTNRFKGVKEAIYITMPLADGDLGTFHDLLAKYGEDATEARKVLFSQQLQQLSGQLAHFHRTANMRVVDIKSPNVLVFGDGSFKLSDFGLVAPPGSINEATLGYNAPEFLAKSTSQGLAADVWALGVTLLDTLLPPEKNPFTTVEHANDEKKNLRAYQTWNARQRRNDQGSINLQTLHSVNRDDARFFHYFNKLAKLQPQAADLLLNQVLHPDPVSRIDAGALARQAEPLAQGARGAERAFAKGIMSYYADCSLPRRVGKVLARHANSL
jgi:hypothetical protein